MKLDTLRLKRTKREAEQIAALMSRCGMDRVRIYGHRGSWTAHGRATLTQLAQFAAREAEIESKK